jgi:hypothetical protein
MLAAWQTAVTECAVLRCGHLTGRVERAEPKPPRLVGPLTDVLDGRLADSDTAGAATVLAALVPLLEHLPPRQGRLGKRNATLAWVDARASSLAALGRCSEDDGCPACRAGEPCALDLWPDTVAQLALGDPERYARGFFEMTGKEAGTGAYTSWLGRGVDQRVCDAALWRCVEHWRAVEMFNAPSRSSSSAGPPVAATPTSPTPTPDSSPRRAVWRATSVRSTSATKRLASRTVRPIPDGRAYGRDATSSPADGNGWWCARRGSSTRTATRSPPVGTTRPSHAGPGRCGSSMPAPLPVRTPNKRPLDLPAAAGSGAATTPGWLPAAGSPSRALSTGQ